MLRDAGVTEKEIEERVLKAMALNRTSASSWGSKHDLCLMEAKSKEMFSN